jgi:hypothetical protein
MKISPTRQDHSRVISNQSAQCRDQLLIPFCNRNSEVERIENMKKQKTWPKGRTSRKARPAHAKTKAIQTLQESALLM